MITSTKDSALRQAAMKKGYCLIKSRRKCDINNRGGYMITDFNSCLVVGEKFDFSPEDVRDFLNS